MTISLQKGTLKKYNNNLKQQTIIEMRVIGQQFKIRRD